MRLRPDTAKPKFSAARSETDRESRRSKPVAKKPAPKPKKAPKIGALYDAPYVPLGQGTQERQYRAPRLILNQYKAQAFPSVGRPAPEDSIRTAPDIQLMNIPHKPDARYDRNANATAYTGAAYINFLDEQRKKALVLDAESIKFNNNSFPGLRAKRPTSNHERFQRDIDKNPIYKRMLDDSVHGKEMILYASSIGMPLPDSVIAKYASSIVDGFKAGVMNPDEIPDIVLNNSQKVTVRRIQANVKALGWNDKEIAKMNFGQLLQALAGKGKYRTLGGPFKNLPGNRTIPTAFHNLAPDFASQVVGLVPAMVGAGNAFAQDFAEGMQRLKAGASGKPVPGDQIPLPRTREFTKEMAKEQWEFAKMLAKDPVDTFATAPVTTGLIAWSALRGGAGALGRVPKFARVNQPRKVTIGNYANTGESGAILRQPIPGQTRMPGMDERMPPMPGGPTRGIDSPLNDDRAGAPTVHERQFRIGGMEGNFGKTDANGKLIFDAQAVKQEFSRRTGRHMTPDELAKAKRDFEFTYGLVNRLESGRLSHADAEEAAANLQEHITATNAKIEAQRAAAQREASLMGGIGHVERFSERTANLRTVRNERNQLAADIYTAEQGLNDVLTPENFRQAVASHEQSIKDLTARIESDKFPTQEAPLRQMIAIHEQLIDTLREQHANTATAHRAARNNIRGMQDKLRRMDDDLLNEHIALNIPHPSVERRIPVLEEQLAAATKAQRPAAEQAEIKRKLDAARTIGKHDDETDDFYSLTKDMGPQWFASARESAPNTNLPLFHHRPQNRSPIALAHSAYVNKHMHEGTHTPHSEELHYELEQALGIIADGISTGGRIENTLGVTAVKKAAREVYGDDWHRHAINVMDDEDRLKMIDMLQRAQKYLVRDIDELLKQGYTASFGQNVRTDFEGKRTEQLAQERIAANQQQAREQAFREAASPMTPEQVTEYRQETGAGKVSASSKTGKKRISPLLNVEGNVLFGRFPGRDPEGLRNPKINTWQRFNAAIQSLHKFRNDEATLIQLQNRLMSMMDERRRKLNTIDNSKWNRAPDQLDNLGEFGIAMPNAPRPSALPLEEAATTKLLNDIRVISLRLDTIYNLLQSFRPRGEGVLPYSKAQVYTPHPKQLGQKPYFHGTSVPDLTPDTLNAYETSVDSLFGPGLYTTDYVDIADTYAVNRSRYSDPGSKSREITYELELNPEHSNFIDLMKPLPNTAAQAFSEFGRAFDLFVEQHVAKSPDEEMLVENAINNGINRGYTGEEIWDHISSALINWAGNHNGPGSYYGLLHKLRRDLMDAGYDGFQHIGGQRMGDTEHHVVIMFDPKKSVADMGEARTTSAPSWKKQADDAVAEMESRYPPPGTDVVPYKDRTPVFDPKKKVLNPREQAEWANRLEREREAAKAIHGDTPPKQVPPVKGGAAVPSRQMTTSAAYKIHDPLIVYRMPYSKNLIDRAVEWIDDRMLESTNPKRREYQDRFLRNRYAEEQGHVRRAFYMWREDLGPLLEAAKAVTTEEGLAVTGALAQGVTVEQMVRASQKLVDMNIEKLRRDNIPQELQDIVDGQVPDDRVLGIAQRFAEDNDMPEHARVIQNFRKKMKDKDWIDDGLFNAYIANWWVPDIDLQKQADFWKTVHAKVGDKPSKEMLHLLAEMRKASEGVDDMLAAEKILPREVMDNRRYQRQNLVSAILGEQLPIDTGAVYVPDRASVVHPSEHLMRRSRSYSAAKIFGGRLQRNQGKLLMSGKVNPTFGSYYTALTSAKSKVEAIKLQRDILETYSHKVPVSQLSYDRNKFYLYNGKTGVTYNQIATREIFKELTSVMGGEEAQYGLADLGNRQDILNRGTTRPLHTHADVKRLTPEEIASAKRGDLYLIPHPIWDGIAGQVTRRQASGQKMRIVQNFTNWWRTLVLKLRPAYLPVNIAESGIRAGLYGGVGPTSYYRLARMEARFGHLMEDGTTVKKALFPSWLHRTTFTGDITTKLNLGSASIKRGKIARQQARDFAVKAEREIREQVPFGGVGVDIFKFFPGLGYGDAIFRLVADGENAMRQAHVAMRLLKEARGQTKKWWQPGRYVGRLNENMFLQMKKIAEGKDISQGAAMDEILRDTTRLLGDFSKAHHAGFAIVAPFYRWIGFITKFTLMEAMYRRPARAYLYGQLSQMSWSQLQAIGIMPANIAGAIPLGELEQADEKDPATGQRDKMLSVLYSQAWNGPMTLLNVTGYNPGRGEFDLGGGLIKQVNPLAQLAFAATTLRDPSTMREFETAQGTPLDRTDLFTSNINILLAQFARQLWPVMLGQDYSEMADTSIPYLHDVFKDDQSPLGQPQSSTGEKIFATVTGLRRRKIDLTKLQISNIKKAQSEMAAMYTGLRDRRNYPNGPSPAQVAFRKEIQDNWLHMLTSIDQWWQLHHTNPFDPKVQAGVQETVPSVLDSSLAEEEAFNEANR